MLIESALYLTATPLGADYVEGVQGRYYLPYLPLAGLEPMGLLPARAGLVRVVRRSLPAAMIALMVLGLATSAHAFWSGVS